MATIQALNSSESVEWYTPAPYVEAARRVLGGIDLDPASCAKANATVCAYSYFTLDQKDCDHEGMPADGLQMNWANIVAGTRVNPGRLISNKVFLNPPYGRDGQRAWSQKLLAEYRCGNVGSAILLVNACTSERWFAPLWQFPICFTDHRIKFTLPTAVKNKTKQEVDSGRLIRSGGTKGQAFVFLPDIREFREQNSELRTHRNPARCDEWWHEDPAIASFIGEFSQFGFIYLPNALALQMREAHRARKAVAA